jgi:hypothetical protein
MPVTVRIRYPDILEDKAKRIATIFMDPEIKIELVEDSIDEIVIEGPSFATADPTRATAMLRRYMIALKKRDGRK